MEIVSIKVPRNNKRTVMSAIITTGLVLRPKMASVIILGTLFMASSQPKGAAQPIISIITEVVTAADVKRFRRSLSFSSRYTKNASINA